jgi:hypothetical protein
MDDGVVMIWFEMPCVCGPSLVKVRREERTALNIASGTSDRPGFESTQQFAELARYVYYFQYEPDTENQSRDENLQSLFSLRTLPQLPCAALRLFMIFTCWLHPLPYFEGTLPIRTR